MCLRLRHGKSSLRPWNKSRIRYKWMWVERGHLYSPNQNTKAKRSKGKLVLISNAKAELKRKKYEPESHGIHVHATLKSAKTHWWYGCQLFKVRCRGFLRSGDSLTRPEIKEETWEQVEFVIPRGKKHPVPISPK